MKKLTERLFQSDVLIFALYLALAFLAYGLAIQAPFLFDDAYNIVTNHYIRDLGYIADYFTNPNTHNSLPENSPYRPLCTLIYALLWNLGDGSTIPYHVYKIALHAAAGWFAFQILTRLCPHGFSRPTIGLAAAAFVLHPANAETVNYISSTSTLQCSVFYLAAFYFYLRGQLALMTALFLGAVFTKEEGATFPALVFLHGSLLRDRKVNFKAFGLATMALAVYLTIYLTIPKTVNFSDVERLPYLYTQFRAWFQYLSWIFWPTGFAIEHMGFGFSESLFEARVLAPFIGALALLTWMTWQALRPPSVSSSERRFFLFSMFWFFIALAPTSSVFPLAEPINEHRYYLSYALLIPTLIVWLAAKIRHWPTSRQTLLTLIVSGLLIVLTLEQTWIWRSPETVWQNAAQVDSTNARVFLNLGVTQIRNGQFEKARENLIRCAELKPDYPYCYLNLGVVWLQLQNINEAQANLEKAYQLNHELVPALAHLGEFYIMNAGRSADGLKLLDDCHRLSRGGFDRCLNLRPLALRTLGRNEDALAAAEDLRKRNPEDRVAQFEYGLSLLALDQLDASHHVFSEILATHPNDIQSLHNLSWIEKRRGNEARSAELWQKKLKLESQQTR